MLLPVALWQSLGALLAFAVLAWLWSLVRDDVSFVDSLWPLFFLLAVLVYVSSVTSLTTTGLLVVGLVTVWSLRLAIHITVRNWGEEEDSRYQAIRANNQPHFRFKSLYIVFGLQAVLAWIISVPLLYGVADGGDFGALQRAALLLWILGFVFEAGGDWQLMRFKQQRTDSKAVLDSGLWRYTRHPNYFGDACIWWSYWLFALGAGAWWTVFAPLLMTLLLLKVSGVSLMEKTITERKPGYADYIRRTSAFLPLPPKPRRGDVDAS